MATVQSLVEGYGPDFPSLETLLGLEPTDEQKLLNEQPTAALGRYLKDVAFLREVTSQRVVGLVRFKVLIERFIALNRLLTAYEGVHKNKKVVHSLTPQDEAALRQLARELADVVRAEAIEKFTEHDTAAAGDYLKLLIGTQLPYLEPMIEGVAFADTSEDTMGPTFGLIANKLVFGCFLPKVLDLMELLMRYVDEIEKDRPLTLPGLTHQQGAEPTTFGKKVMTNLVAVDRHICRMMEGEKFIPFTGKLGGAIGNMTTHYATYPDIDWRAFARNYVEGLGLTYEEMTFQASTFALEISHFTELAHMMTHIIKLAQDFISMASCPGQLFVKRKRKGTKGSSIMPNKSNAWAVEGALRMLKAFRAALFEYAQILPDYPHEGDMGRSYLFRELGSVFMPGFIALSRIGNEVVGDMTTRGYTPNAAKVAAFFHEYPGMAGSSLQTVLKREGIEGDAYRQIEAIAIERDGTYTNAYEFALGLKEVMAANSLPQAVRDELLTLLSPGNNVGDADILTKKWRGILQCRIEVYRAKLARYEQPLV